MHFKSVPPFVRATLRRRRYIDGDLSFVLIINHTSKKNFYSITLNRPFSSRKRHMLHACEYMHEVAEYNLRTDSKR